MLRAVSAAASIPTPVAKKFERELQLVRVWGNDSGINLSLN